MNNEVGVVAGVGLDQKTRKSHWPARLDLVQSASGLCLGLFMWGHMAFVSSILISKDAMWWITKMFEGQFVFGRPYPAIVSCVVALVSVMFVLHAALAMGRALEPCAQGRSRRDYQWSKSHHHRARRSPWPDCPARLWRHQ
jgi:fumarate reductase subunit C